MNEINSHYDRSSFNNLDPKVYKQFRYQLIGLCKQIDYLKEISQNIFSKCNSLQNDWNSDISKIKNNFFSLLNDFPKINTDTFIKDLNAINEHQSKIFKFSNEKEIIHDKNDFLIDTSKIGDLFKEVRDKLSNMNEKINLKKELVKEEKDNISKTLKLLFFRVKNFLPEIPIFNELKQSLEKDDKRIKKFENLKNAWVNALLASRNASIQATNEHIEIDFTQKIQDLNKIYNSNKSFFLQIKSKFDWLNVVDLSKFNGLSKEVIRSKTSDYIKFSGKFLEEKIKMTELAKSMIQFEKYVDIIIKEIDEDFELIKNYWDEDENCNFLEDSIKSEFRNQKSKSLENLRTKKVEITEQWNDLYLNILKLRHQINLYENFKHISEKMSTCYMICAGIILDLAQMPTEDENIKNFNFTEIRDEYHRAYDLFLLTNKTNSDNNNIILKINTEKSKEDLSSSTLVKDDFSDKLENKGIIIENETYNDKTLKDEFEATKIISELSVQNGKISFGVKDEKVGLKGNIEAATKKYNSIGNELVDELKNYKEKTHLAYNQILRNAYKDTVEAINLVSHKFMPSDKEQPQSTYYFSSWFSSKKEEKQSYMPIFSPYDKL